MRDTGGVGMVLANTAPSGKQIGVLSPSAPVHHPHLHVHLQNNHPPPRQPYPQIQLYLRKHALKTLLPIVKIESVGVIHDPITTTSSVSASSHTFHKWKQNASSISTHTMLEMSQAYLGRKSCVMVGAPRWISTCGNQKQFWFISPLLLFYALCFVFPSRFVRKLLMVVPVEKAIAVLSTVSLEDEHPEVQGPGVWVSFERSAIESPIGAALVEKDGGRWTE
ncbi:hypothetical protein Fmac_032413 [Flemingia macrophylla]|uniref:Uncharacterized protein n=1 Tax=Flemingia macrophylla TaxID=520843 RepID=A0ABD1L4W1_9FABA